MQKKSLIIILGSLTACLVLAVGTLVALISQLPRASRSTIGQTSAQDAGSGTKGGDAGSGSALIGQSLVDYPDDGLVNEQGQSVSFETLPNQPVLMSFIYTRCPMPTMCPRITRKMHQVQAKMQQIQKQMDQSGSNPVHFVSVTFDPDYDSPKVLRKYGESYEIDLDSWDFWTGPAKTIKKLTDQLNIETYPSKNGQIMHNMRTFVLDRNRIVQAVYRGSGWSPEKVADRLGTMVR